jgi:1-phosphofructokinase
MEVDELAIGKTNIAKRKRIRAAGKALNVASDIATLGGNAFATGFMYTGSKMLFEAMLAKKGVAYSFIENEGRVRENYKLIDRRSMLTEINTEGPEVAEGNKALLLDKVHTLSQTASITIISGGLPQNVAAAYYGELFRAVAPNSLRIADATAGKLAAALSAGVDLVKPNVEELQNALGYELHGQKELLEGCYELIRRGAKAVLLSLGKAGAIYTDGKKNYFCKSSGVAVNSTVGAGDAMVAAAALAMEKGLPMPEILRAGVAAGTAAVTTFDESVFPVEKYYEVYNGLSVTEI